MLCNETYFSFIGRSNGELEPEEQIKKREEILDYLQGLLNQWIKECFRERVLHYKHVYSQMYSDDVVQQASGLICPYGSFALRVCSSESDMDMYYKSADYYVGFVLFLER